jgi:GT2 family glycosyltransferase
MDAVIVTHNSERDLTRLLSCRAITGGFGQLVVVDNRSDDATAEVAADAGVTLIARDVNDGFGAAANVGARRTSGTSFALLNPDIFFTDPATVERAETLISAREIGIVAPGLRLPHGALQDSARQVPSPLDLAARRLSRHQSTRGVIRSTEPVVVPWAVGACWFVGRSAWERVGGFDERYFLYFEDVDLCVRMRRAGLGVLYVPTLEVEHRHVGASRSRRLSWAMRQHVKSAVRFYRQHPTALFNTAAFDARDAPSGHLGPP